MSCLSMAREKQVEEEELEEEAATPIHGDILQTILAHVPLIDLVHACHVSNDWKSAVFSSLGHLNPIRPWLIVHTQSTSRPYRTTSHAYDPRSHQWLEIEQPPIKEASALRSSHSTLLYMQSPSKFAFSFDPLHTKWNRVEAPLAWRTDPIVALVGHQIVIAGGTCEFMQEELPMETYDLRTGTWDTFDSFPATLKDSAASMWLSIAVDEHRLYVSDKSSAVAYSFNPSTKTWKGPYDLRPGNNVFSSVIGFVNDRMVLVGLIGDSDDVKGVKLWEVKGQMSELSEMSEMPNELVEKLKGQSLSPPSIAMTSAGDFAYLHNPSDPGELILCEIANGECKWGSTRNSVVNDVTRMQRLVFTCSKVGLGDLHEVQRSGNLILKRIKNMVE